MHITIFLLLCHMLYRTHSKQHLGIIRASRVIGICATWSIKTNEAHLLSSTEEWDQSQGSIYNTAILHCFPHCSSFRRSQLVYSQDSSSSFVTGVLSAMVLKCLLPPNSFRESTEENTFPLGLLYVAPCVPKAISSSQEGTS